eukprot:283809-Prorocentrum_minimum.AAC.1
MQRMREAMGADFAAKLEEVRDTHLVDLERVRRTEGAAVTQQMEAKYIKDTVDLQYKLRTLEAALKQSEQDGAAAKARAGQHLVDTQQVGGPPLEPLWNPSGTPLDP